MFDLISPRAFTSLWYWIFVAVYWSRVMQAPLGVPGDLLRRAGREDDSDARRDVLAVAGVHARRWTASTASLGIWRAAAWGFSLSTLAILALAFRIELAQAFLLLAAPSALVSYSTGRVAERLSVSSETEAEAVTILGKLRARVQWIGTVSVFLTAIFGSYANLVRFVI